MNTSGKTLQCTDTVLMLRPNHFGYNEATAGSNLFQSVASHLTPSEIHTKALAEFDGFKNSLEQAGVHVVVFDDTPEPRTPDAIFPNNWLSTHAEGLLVLYPMEGKNRRDERRPDIIQRLKDTFAFGNVCDLTSHELNGRYLEGTGSMVIDRKNGVAYACRSSRTDEGLVRDAARSLGLKRSVIFEANVMTNEETGFEQLHPIYHTNVMMSIGELTAVICAEAIRSDRERGEVMSSLRRDGYEVMEITTGQLHKFAGNLLQLRGKDGDRIWAMSSQAFGALTARQRFILTADGSRIVHSPLDTVELVGGGSARCMLAEIFPPSRLRHG